MIPRKNQAISRGLTALASMSMSFIAKVEIGVFHPPPDPEQGYIIVANHRSMLDLIVGLLVIRRWQINPYIFIREDFFEIPVVGFLLRAVGGIPAGSRNGVTALRSGLEILRSGGVLIVMPEGKIIRPEEHHTLGKLMPGVARLASASKNPVLVAGILNTELAWPLGDAIPHFHLRRLTRPNIVVRAEWLTVNRGAKNTETLIAISDRMRSILHSLQKVTE